ncbi:MAG: hypothetical protein ACREMQ_10195 [Longimicrobiales bacterium]
MVRRLLVPAVVAVLVTGVLREGARAQFTVVSGVALQDSLASNFRVDFAIPDGPAFALLPSNPSTILRPAGVRDLVMSIADFAGPDGFRIPNALGIELSPALLIMGGRLSLASYQANPALYRLRLSGATQRSTLTGDVTQLSLGMRISLIDESDLRTNPEYVSQATAVAEEINEIAFAARLRAGPPPAALVLTAEEKARIAELNRLLKERWGNQRWNADMLDLAVAARAGADDLDGSDLEMAEYSAWATFGKGFGTWGQLLLGAKAQAVQDSLGDDDFSSSVQLLSRLYIGRNFYKAYAEGAVELGDADVADWFVNVGAEVRLRESIWSTFAAGFAPESDDGETRLRARLALKLGLPRFGGDGGG